MKTPNITAFRAWAIRHAQTGHSVLMARAYAQLMRERVDAYIQPLFASYTFYVSDDVAARTGRRERITDIKRLYLTNLQGRDYLDFLEDCDHAHRKHGFTGPAGHCPALVAEELQRKAEYALLLAASDLFGVELQNTYGETRANALDLLIGATIKAWSAKNQRIGA